MAYQEEEKKPSPQKKKKRYFLQAKDYMHKNGKL